MKKGLIILFAFALIILIAISFASAFWPFNWFKKIIGGRVIQSGYGSSNTSSGYGSSNTSSGYGSLKNNTPANQTISLAQANTSVNQTISLAQANTSVNQTAQTIQTPINPTTPAAPYYADKTNELSSGFKTNISLTKKRIEKTRHEIFLREGEEIGFKDEAIIYASNHPDKAIIIKAITLPFGSLENSKIYLKDVLTGEQIFESGLIVGINGEAAANINGNAFYFKVNNKSRYVSTLQITWGDGASFGVAGNEQDYFTISSASLTECESGCISEGKCYSFGYRDSEKYCSADEMAFMNQKEREIDCENQFECRSNSCISGKCADVNAINKIANWFKNLFSR